MLNKRKVGVDVCRFIAAFGVIAQHIQTHEANVVLGRYFNPLCVPFFYIMSFFFFIKGIDKEQVLEKIQARILRPYLAWTFIYSSLLLVKSIFLGGHFKFNFFRVLFFGESAVQLYFLPILLSLQLLLFYGRNLVLIKDSGNNNKAIIGLLLVIIYLSISISFNSFGLGSVLRLLELGSYIVIAFLLVRFEKVFEQTSRYFYIGGCLIILVCLTINITNITIASIVGGLSLSILSLSVKKINLGNKVIALLGYSFGVYLCHVVILEFFELLYSKLFNSSLAPTLLNQLLEITIIFLCSLLAVFATSYSRVTKKYLWGDSVV